MKNDKNEILESALKIIQNLDSKEAVASVTSHLLNALMSKERDISLKQQLDNKANGFYNRNLACSLGNLSLDIPRDRNANFRPSIIPNHWQRIDDSFENLLVNLILHSYSPNKIKSLLESMNLPYSAEQINEIKDELYSKALDLKSAQISENSVAIFIDAFHSKIKDFDSKIVKKAVIYSILGIDLKGKKSLLGYYIFFGSETKEDWLVIFNDLISRGLKRTMLIVSDDFPGLSAAISALFPNSLHQLCFIHMQRNVRKNMAKSDAKIFNDELAIIKNFKDFDKAVSNFNSLCDSVDKKYPHFVKLLKKNSELYFNFLKFPEAIRKHIYTTNAVESFNSRLEVLRVNSGGYFQSTKTADIAIFVSVSKLLKTKWKSFIPAFREAQYEINQLFNLMFQND